MVQVAAQSIDCILIYTYPHNDEVHAAPYGLGDIEDEPLGQFEPSSFLRQAGCYPSRQGLITRSGSGFGPQPNDLDFLEVFAGRMTTGFIDLKRG